MININQTDRQTDRQTCWRICCALAGRSSSLGLLSSLDKLCECLLVGVVTWKQRQLFH